MTNRSDSLESAIVLIQYRKKLKTLSLKRNTFKKPRRVIEWKHPVSVERSYGRYLVNVINKLHSSVKEKIVVHLKSIISDRNKTFNVDGWADDVERLTRLVKTDFDSIPENPTFDASAFANKTDVWNDTQWRKILKSTFGVDILQREPWLEDTLKSWTSENVAKISKMKEEYLANVEGIVQNGIRAGRSHRKIAKDILKNTDVTKSRARLIARDQVSKLNGQLTENRQISLGVKKYRWHDSDDIRVRKTHQDNDGKTFEWGKPPKTGHPGQDYQCRCWAEPIFDEILNELNIQI